MWCRASPCGAVLCRAVLSFEHIVLGITQSTRYQASCEVLGTRYPYVRVYSFSCFLYLIVLSVLMLLFCSQITPVYRRSQHGIANKHKARHRAMSSAEVALGIIKSLVAPNHGPLLSAPFPFSCMLPCVSVAERRRPCSLV